MTQILHLPSARSGINTDSNSLLRHWLSNTKSDILNDCSHFCMQHPLTNSYIQTHTLHKHMHVLIDMTAHCWK